MAVMSYSSSWYQLYERTLTLTIALYRVTDYFPKAEILRNHLRSKANEVFEQITEYGVSGRELNGEVDPVIQRIRTIKGYLAIASTLNYVRPVNFTILEKEYGMIEQFLHSEKARLIKQELGEDVKNLGPAPFLHPMIEKKPVVAGLEQQEVFSAAHVHPLSRAVSEDKDSKGKETDITEKRFYERKDESLNERQKTIIALLKKTDHARISDFYPSFDGVSSKTIQRDLQYLVDKRVLKKEGEKRWTIYSLEEGYNQVAHL